MTILALALGSLALAVTGRKTFGTWFNHVTHYSVIWGISLILFELRFIDYYRLEDETWMYIVLAWVSFTVGALIVPLAGYPTRRAGERPAGDPPVDPGYDDRRVRNAVIAMSAVAGAAVVQHWMILIERFGSVFNVVVLGNLVYSLRVQEGFKFGVPYLDSLALAASFFAGLLISIRQRFSLISVLPFLIVVAEAVGMMGRMKILMSVILFFAGYFLNSRTAPTARLAGATSIVRRWTTVGVAVLLFVASVELVRSSRGSIESIPGASGTLRSLRGGAFITPSLYLYLTVDHGVFNQYLKKDEERTPPGGNILAPAYKVLAAAGLDVRVPEYQKFYSTPASANTGSYLREVHADFGPAGILVVPFILGLLSSLLWAASLDRGRLVSMVALAHLFVIVDVSFIVTATRTGYWLVSLLAGIAAALYVRGGRETA